MNRKKIAVLAGTFLLILLGCSVLASIINAQRLYIQKVSLEASAIRVGVEDGSELNIFQRLREVREKQNLRPAWNGHKYILWNPRRGKNIDPFLWKTSLSASRMGDRTLVLNKGDYDVLFDNFLMLDLSKHNYLKELYTSEVFGRRTVLRDNRFIVVDDVNPEGYEITLKQALLRDEAIRWGLYRWSRSEAFLREHGYIMMDKKDVGCVPVNLATREQLALPAKTIVVARVIREINNLSTIYGEGFFTKEGFLRTGTAISLNDPRYLGLVAVRLLNLYDVRIRWDESRHQYEVMESAQVPLAHNS